MNNAADNLLNWLEKFLERLPKKQNTEKSFYEIARFPRRENVISNVMQFYFNEEEHGFGRLFFDALIECLRKENLISEEEITIYNSTYIVQREFKNIDILIKDCLNKWAIIIEHKVDHWLNNPLDKYWLSVQAENKILVVLSLHDILIPNFNEEMKLINITYSKFITELDMKVIQYKNGSVGKHLYFIQDFIQHLKKINQMSQANVETENSLRSLQENMNNVTEVFHLRNRLREYMISQLTNAFGKIGFLPYYQSKDRAWNHFLMKESFFENRNMTKPISFRFFVDMEKLFEKNTLELYFEIFGEDTKHGILLRDYLLQNKLITEPLVISDGEKKDDYVHLAGYLDFVLNGAELLEKQFEKLLFKVFLKDDGSGILKICADQLKWYKDHPDE